MKELIQYAENEFGIPALQHEFDHMGYLMCRDEQTNTGKNSCYYQE